jgi:hypothetical protein
VCLSRRKFAEGGRESGDLRLVSSAAGGRRIKVKREEATVTGCDRSATRVEGEREATALRGDSRVKDGTLDTLLRYLLMVAKDGDSEWKSSVVEGYWVASKREGGEVEGGPVCLSAQPKA